MNSSKSDATASKLKRYFHKKESPLRQVRWHQSWVVRGAIIGSFIIICGYSASVTIAVQGIQSVSHIAYDPEVESLLGEHLNSIKKIHSLQQEILVTRLKRLLPDEQNSENSANSEKKIRRLLKLAKFNHIAPLDQISIRKLTTSELKKFPNIKTQPLAWVSREALRIHKHLVTLPQGRIRRKFEVAQGLKHRYQLVRATWNDQIQPTFIRVNLVIMAITFLILTTTLFLLARSFKKRTETLLTGFSVWSERDSTYRFGDSWTGELRLIAIQFNRMADEVEANRQKRLYLEKMASWQIIARKLAHEIKNPLTPIQMMVSQLVRRYEGNDEKYQKLLADSQAIIVEEVSGLRRMVDNFSRFAQLPEPKLESDDLVDLCRLTVELEKAAFSKHEITFESSFEKALANVDRQLLRQVLINLIKNAAEAINQDSGQIQVVLSGNTENYFIAVIDNGPGIPPDLKSRIFEAYFTTKHTGPTPGMGLGLAVCQKVIIDHGGDITVESEPGKTSFIISLPQKKKGLQDG